jgi:hypothetical protein
LRSHAEKKRAREFARPTALTATVPLWYVYGTMELPLELVYETTTSPAAYLLLRVLCHAVHRLPPRRLACWYDFGLLRRFWRRWRGLRRVRTRVHANSWRRRLHRDDDPIMPM